MNMNFQNNKQNDILYPFPLPPFGGLRDGEEEVELGEEGEEEVELG
jgi:hypothetical protein